MGYELASSVWACWSGRLKLVGSSLSIFPFLIVVNLGLEELAFLTVIGSNLFEDKTSLAILFLSAWYFFSQMMVP